MSGKFRLQKAVQQNRKDNPPPPPVYSGDLGITRGGQQLVEVPNRPGYVYVRLRNDRNELISALNAGGIKPVSLVYDLPVLVVRDQVNPNRWLINGVDSSRYQDWGSTSFLPNHGGQHSLDPNSPGADPVWVWDRQFLPLAVVPSGSSGAGNLILEPGTFYVDNDRYFAGITGTPDLLAYKPTGSTARMVLIYVDRDGNPQVSLGSHFSASLTGSAQVEPYIPGLAGSAGVQIAGVRLVSGTSRLLWDNIYDRRPFFFTMSGTSGGGAGGYTTIQDDGTPLTQRNTLNFVGAGFVVYDNGGVTNVSGTASSTGGVTGSGYQTVEDEGTPLTQRTTINVVGTGLVAYDSGGKTVISGTVGSGLPSLGDNVVLFTNDATNLVYSDLMRFYYSVGDTQTGNLVLGSNRPVSAAQNGSMLNIVYDGNGVGSYNDQLYFWGFGYQNTIKFYRSNGTEASPTQVNSGDILSYVNWAAKDDVEGSYQVPVSWTVYAIDNFVNANGDFGAGMLFEIAPSGSSLKQEALELTAEHARFNVSTQIDPNGAHYFGDRYTDGSFRLHGFTASGVALEQRIGGDWISKSLLLPTGSVIQPHHTQHEDGGSDELNVYGLHGLLADEQNAGYIKGILVGPGFPTNGDMLRFNGAFWNYSGSSAFIVSESDGSPYISGVSHIRFTNAVVSDDGNGLVTVTVSGSVTDHGALTGLPDDDHTQYHNDTRGDARYYTQTQLQTSGSAQVNWWNLTGAPSDLVNRNKSVAWTFEGELGAVTGSVRFANHTGRTLYFVGGFLNVDGAPAGQSIIVDFVKGAGSSSTGASIFTAPNRPQVPAGSLEGSGMTLSTLEWLDGEWIKTNIVQVGIGVPGSYLTASLTYY